MRWTASLFAVAFFMHACASSSDDAGDLEARLSAPCCWRQTLADHESPLATELRAEIAARVAAGEPLDVIERSLVARYGERIRAGGDRRPYIGGIAGVLIAIGLIGIVISTRRSRRRHAHASTTRPEAPDDRERLDDELASIPD